MSALITWFRSELNQSFHSGSQINPFKSNNFVFFPLFVFFRFYSKYFIAMFTCVYSARQMRLHSFIHSLTLKNSSWKESSGVLIVYGACMHPVFFLQYDKHGVIFE